MTSADLLVLGAGPAGTGAAQRAAKQGRAVTLLERGVTVGGASASFEVAGIRVDHGSHRLHRSIEPRILAELDRLLGPDLQVRQRRGRIDLAGRWLGFPLRPVDLVRNLPPDFAARTAIEAVTAPWRSPSADTFSEVVRAQLGPTMLDRFYGPYARKLWGHPPDELAGEQARRRISAGSAGQLLKRVLAGRDADARSFRYPRRGFGQLWERLAEDAVAHGADLQLETTVRAIVESPDHVEVHTGPTDPQARTGTSGVFTAPHVWSTLPLPLLARMWSPAPSAEVLAAAARLRSRAMVLVYVVLATPRYTDFDAHYLPEAWTPLTRFSEPANYRDDPARPTDRTVLCAEIPCDVGDPIWRADDAYLGDVVTTTLERLGLPTPAVLDVVSRRLPSAYPILTLGALDDIAVVENWAAERERLLTFGRQGLFVHDNSHHALSMAWAAADALGGRDTLDRAAWRTSRAGFRDHVVED